MAIDAASIIQRLQLKPHPEGGWFRETWRAETDAGRRAAGTAIYFLLEDGQRSHWHRVDAAEIWHFYAGAPLTLSIAEDHGAVRRATLGPALDAGQTPQEIVPANAWQSAETSGAWSLVGCTVSPGFEVSGFTLAPDGWSPGD
ncbi:MAG: cupin domain-containing protein [Pseudomonadota bacterium]